MSDSPSIESLKIKAKLLQKTKQKSGQDYALKDAFQIIAHGMGYASWRELKTDFESSDLFIPSPSSHYWKTWYSSYEEAAKHLQQGDGFLIPYRRQFFICDSHYIEYLGIPSDDPDLAKVGHNWADPKDAEAWKRILKRIEQRRKNT